MSANLPPVLARDGARTQSRAATRESAAMKAEGRVFVERQAEAIMRVDSTSRHLH